MEQEFRDIKEVGGHYQVSNDGVVRSVDRWLYDGRWGKRLYKGKVIIGSKTVCGYPQVSMRFNRKSITRPVHRLVAVEFIENPYNLPTVNHKDGNKQNNDVSNLEWASWKDNLGHAMRTGILKVHGENCGASKLTEEQALEIYELYSTGGHTQSEVANMFGVSRETVSGILNGHTWKYLNLTPTKDMRTDKRHQLIVRGS